MALMKIPQSATEIALADRSTRSMDVRRRPVEVSTVDGQVLVTFEGDPEDHVVAAGDAFRANGRGRLVVAALRPSTVRIRSAATREAAMPSERLDFHRSPPAGVAIARPARGLWRDFLGGAVMLAVWLFLWSWFALEVVAPLSGARRELERREAIHERA